MDECASRLFGGILGLSDFGSLFAMFSFFSDHYLPRSL